MNTIDRFVDSGEIMLAKIAEEEEEYGICSHSYKS